MQEVFVLSRVLLIVIFTVIFSTVSATDETKKDADGWKGEAELGIITTRGNTNTSTSNAKLRVEYRELPWTHQLKLESVRAEDNNQVTADRSEAGFRSKYQFSQRGYYYGSIRHEDDPFSGFDQRTTEILGYGRNMYQGETFLFDLEMGVGARQTERTDNTSSDESILRLATNMKWKISETSSLSEELFVERGDVNTLTESTTDLKVKINSALAMKMSVKVKDNSDVQVGKKHTDTETAVTLVYDF